MMAHCRGVKPRLLGDYYFFRLFSSLIKPLKIGTGFVVVRCKRLLALYGCKVPQLWLAEWCTLPRDNSGQATGETPYDSI